MDRQRLTKLVLLTDYVIINGLTSIMGCGSLICLSIASSKAKVQSNFICIFVAIYTIISSGLVVSIVTLGRKHEIISRLNVRGFAVIESFIWSICTFASGATCSLLVHLSIAYALSAAFLFVQFGLYVYCFSVGLYSIHRDSLMSN